jgi:ureidoglycolate lyase
MAITPEQLTAEAFSRFGDVIDVQSARDCRVINGGNTHRYHNLARLSLTADRGTPLVNVFRSTPLPLPVTLKSMERHPLSSQTFYPLSANPYLVVVAPPGELRETEIRVFIATSTQGVNYHPGTWHHYSLALNSVSDFLVIDRGGREENCDEADLINPLVIDLGGKQP